ALSGWAEQLRDVLLRELQADPDLVALPDAVAAREQQDLLGEARRQRQGVEVLDGVEEQAQTPAVETKQRLVQLDVVREELLEVGLANDEQRRRAVRVGIVRSRHTVEEGDVAEPGARLDVGERDLLAGEGNRADPNCDACGAAPFLGRR